jgi:hypothetical protein
VRFDCLWLKTLEIRGRRKIVVRAVSKKQIKAIWSEDNVQRAR